VDPDRALKMDLDELDYWLARAKDYRKWSHGR
jgi:hypothetical protein